MRISAWSSDGCSSDLTLDRDQMRLVAAWARLKDIEYILGRPYLLTDDGRIPFSESNLAYWRKQLTDLRATRKPPRGYVLRLAILQIGRASGGERVCQYG